MKNRITSGVVTVALGLLIALSPQFLFKVCGAMVDADGYYTYSYSLEGSSLILDGYTYNK
ncbi:MAG: hypothetical protein LBG05_10310 [Treponema sp.]|jgi:hypothetical protein|nr:hypothetical protein [Treponema sp.]